MFSLLYDDDDDNYMLSLLMYQQGRLMNDLNFYTPMGILNEGRKTMKSPMAAESTLNDALKLVYNFTAYPFRTEEERTIQSGSHHGWNKLTYSLLNFAPLIKSGLKLTTIQDNYQYYKAN